MVTTLSSPVRPGLDEQPPAGRAVADLIGGRRPRSDEGHGPADDVEQLGELIEAVPVQEPPDAGVGAVRSRGPEGQQRELAPSTADPGSPPERGAAVAPHGRRADDQDRCDDEERQQCTEAVHRPLDEPRSGSESRVVHAQQRETVDRAHAHARTGTVHQPPVDEQCGAAVVEVVGEMLKADRGPSRRRPDRDGIGMAGQRQRGDAVEVTEHGHAVHGGRTVRPGAGGRAGTDDPPAEAGSAPGALDEGGNPLDVADREHRRHGAAAPAEVGQPAVERAPAGEGEQDDGQHHHDERCPHHVSPEQVETGGGADRGGVHRAVRARVPTPPAGSPHRDRSDECYVGPRSWWSGETRGRQVALRPVARHQSTPLRDRRRRCLSVAAVTPRVSHPGSALW